MHRITKKVHGPLKPKLRTPAEDRAHWGRYDTVGQTVYASDSATTAYMEILSPYRTQFAGEKRALKKTADAMGVPLEVLWSEIASEWHQAGNMHAMWLPQAWRKERLLHSVAFPRGWWIDITATETLTAIRNEFIGGFPDEQQEIADSLTISDVTGEDRLLTTTLASMLRDRVELDDGSLPLGIRFLSKHGNPAGQSGACWAHWLRGSESPNLQQPAALPPAARHAASIRDRRSISHHPISAG